MGHSPSRTKKASVQSNADTQSRRYNVKLTPEMRDIIDKQGKYVENIILALAILERAGIGATQTILMAIVEVKSNAVARVFDLLELNRIIRLEDNILADILLADCLAKDIVKALTLLISAGIPATSFLITKIIAADDPMLLASALYALHMDEILLDENLIKHIAASNSKAQVVANSIRSRYNIDGSLPLLTTQLDSISEEKVASTLPFFDQDQKKTSSSNKEQQAFSENRLG